MENDRRRKRIRQGGQPLSRLPVILVSCCVPNLMRVYSSKKIEAFADQVRELSKEFDLPYCDATSAWIGGSITAIELYFLRGLIDYFVENEPINEDKIGVCGMSYGGMFALHLAAVDTRIKAC